MKQKIFWLRVSYWTGIIVDAGAAILLMFPSLASIFFNWPSYQNDIAFVTVSGIGAALMWGWTFLLFWANQKPVERRGVLLLTVFPVLIVIILTKLITTIQFASPWLPDGILQPILVVLFLYSYFNASRWNNKPDPSQE